MRKLVNLLNDIKLIFNKNDGDVIKSILPYNEVGKNVIPESLPVRMIIRNICIIDAIDVIFNTKIKGKISYPAFMHQLNMYDLDICGLRSDFRIPITHEDYDAIHYTISVMLADMENEIINKRYSTPINQFCEINNILAVGNETKDGAIDWRYAGPIYAGIALNDNESEQQAFIRNVSSKKPSVTLCTDWLLTEIDDYMKIFNSYDDGLRKCIINNLYDFINIDEDGVHDKLVVDNFKYVISAALELIRGYSFNYTTNKFEYTHVIDNTNTTDIFNVIDSTLINVSDMERSETILKLVPQFSLLDNSDDANRILKKGVLSKEHQKFIELKHFYKGGQK